MSVALFHPLKLLMLIYLLKLLMLMLIHPPLFLGHEG